MGEPDSMRLHKYQQKKIPNRMWPLSISAELFWGANMITCHLLSDVEVRKVKAAKYIITLSSPDVLMKKPTGVSGVTPKLLLHQ